MIYRNIFNLFISGILGFLFIYLANFVVSARSRRGECDGDEERDPEKSETFIMERRDEFSDRDDQFLDCLFPPRIILRNIF